MNRQERIVKHINRKQWWHVPPSDPKAYEKRGQFLASSFAAAEFWGRPLDTPIRVTVANPLVGDEPSVHKLLFGKVFTPPADDGKPDTYRKIQASLAWRFDLDTKMKTAALAKGFDSILIMAAPAFQEFKESGKIPRSLELNLLKVLGQVKASRRLG
jgi:hypothetical protein